MQFSSRIIKINPDKSKNEKTIRINPKIPISNESSLIHGIYIEDVKDCPSFKKTSNEIFQFIKKCDIGGFNVLKFDLPLLIEEFLRCNLHLSLKNIKIIYKLKYNDGQEQIFDNNFEFTIKR